MQFTFCKFVTIIFYVWEMAQLLFTEKVGRLLACFLFSRTLKKMQSRETLRSGATILRGAGTFTLKVGRLLTCLRFLRTFKKNAKSGDFAELGHIRAIGTYPRHRGQ
jgi:hypothetical protein